ncbi:hypothetical protein BJ138DRAFT_1105314 [Hygrophoropsis aurantiaca]|uniref:Uncharacterized protein n=1 Tax=Hygrophoropsis aurantiaca TaxID=72124 RepID=A0ACB7ZYY3_9AGAM|nr:hypothetical protein BJ138DRAFT_1105314 [Hygrophoropsis aurantiaca]
MTVHLQSPPPSTTSSAQRTSTRITVTTSGPHPPQKLASSTLLNAPRELHDSAQSSAGHRAYAARYPSYVYSWEVMHDAATTKQSSTKTSKTTRRTEHRLSPPIHRLNTPIQAHPSQATIIMYERTIATHGYRCPLNPNFPNSSSPRSNQRTSSSPLQRLTAAVHPRSSSTLAKPTGHLAQGSNKVKPALVLARESPDTRRCIVMSAERIHQHNKGTDLYLDFEISRIL